MLAGLGALLLMVAGYGFLAWRLSMGLIDALFIAGLALIVAQFLGIQKEPAQGEDSKGEANGRGEKGQVQASAL